MQLGDTLQTRSTDQPASVANVLEEASNEAKEPLETVRSGQGFWDEGEAEIHEPISETASVLDADSWNGTQRSSDRSEHEGQPSRQEDTELGIFRPEEL